MDGFRKLDQGNEVTFNLNASDTNSKDPEAIDVKIVAKDLRY